MRIYMQLPSIDNKPPRFYHLMLQQDMLDGWTLVKEWGVQGSPGRVKKDHHESHEQALSAMIFARDRQHGRGYRTVFSQGEEQPE
ncbi:MAG: WGR domain-containing protein [Gammaproteobacteria bacterium]